MTINFLILSLGLIFSYFYYYKKSFIIKTINFIKSILDQEYGFNYISIDLIPRVQNAITKYLWKKLTYL